MGNHTTGESPVTTANESPQEDGIVRLANIAAQATEVIGEHIKNHEDYETHGGRIADLALAELKPLIEREVSQAIIHAIAQAVEKDRQELLEEIQNRTDEAVIQARDQMEKDAEPLRRETQESREENRKAASALLQAYKNHTLAVEETTRKSTSALLQAYQSATENSERLQRSAAEFLAEEAQTRRKERAEQQKLVQSLLETGKQEAVNETRAAATEMLQQAEARNRETAENAAQDAERAARRMEEQARNYMIASGVAAGTALVVAGAALAVAIMQLF